MSDAKKFRFVSPGIFLNEIDESYLPSSPTIPGPVIIGRAEKGPGMIPVKVGSFSEFVNIFGNPIAGNGAVDDVWRDGNYSSPTYGAYAAQAYLRAGVGPVTFVRLMGTQHADATTLTGEAGWTTTNTPNPTLGSNGGPMGLFVWPSGAAGPVGTHGTHTGSLAAVWYCDDAGVMLSGSTVQKTPYGSVGALTASGQAFKSDASGQFRAFIKRDSGTIIKDVTFSLNPDSDNFIRKMFNTNPQKVNTDITESTQEYYWLGETYERHLVEEGLTTPAVRYGMIATVVSGANFDGSHEKKMPYRDAMTGWFFAQNTSAVAAGYAYDNMTKLFKFVGINGYGDWLQKNIKISITNIKASGNDNVKYGTFDILIRKASDDDKAPKIIEQFSNCTLDPSSMDYVGIKIGDTYRDWDDDEDRYRTFGTYPNRSKFVRIVLEEDVAAGAADPSLLPFGVYGPPRYKNFSFSSASQGTAAVHSHTGFARTHEVSPHFANSGNPDGGAGVVDGAKFCSMGGTALLADIGTASIFFPAVGIRKNDVQDGAVGSTNAFFGLHTGKTGSSTVQDASYSDYLRAVGEDVISSWTDTWDLNGYGSNLEAQWVFSLDELTITKGTSFAPSNPSKLHQYVVWQSGSYIDSTSWNAADSISSGATRYQNILDAKVNRFTSPMFGGFDGLDIKEREPFRNTRVEDAGGETGNYA